MVDNGYKTQTIVSFNHLDEDTRELLKRAVEARKFSYCPYSKFAVGAALKTETGKIFTGCNVESKVYSPTVCAERTAVCKCVSEGHRKIISVAVIANQENCFTTPCGVCREVLSEFGGNNIDVYMARPDMEQVLHMKLSELLPMAFVP